MVQLADLNLKSGRNITIMNNYLRNTGLIMYGTPEIGLAETQAEGAISELSNWLVANNIFLIGSIGTINMQLEWNTIDIQEITMCSMAYLSTISLLTTIIFRKNRRRELLIASGGGFRPETSFCERQYSR